LVFGIWYLVFGIWYLVFGIWIGNSYLVFGIWYLVFGIWYLVFGISYHSYDTESITLLKSGGLKLNFVRS